MTMLPILHLILLPLIIYQTTSFASAVDPTQGFTQLPLDNSNFQIQKPYDVSVNQRYTFTNGVHKFWIYPTDKPFMSGSNTQPRTEIRITVSKNSISQNMFLLLLLLLFCLYIPSYIHHFTLYFYFQGYDYTSGIWQFEGYGYVPSGTSGVCIMQVFGGSSTATTSQLRVYDGSLTYYRSPVLSANIYNRWFRVNAIHDVGANNVKIYIDGWSSHAEKNLKSLSPWLRLLTLIIIGLWSKNSLFPITCPLRFHIFTSLSEMRKWSSLLMEFLAALNQVNLFGTAGRSMRFISSIKSTNFANSKLFIWALWPFLSFFLLMASKFRHAHHSSTGKLALSFRRFAHILFLDDLHQ